jgi:putative cell wall-binding protein
MSLPRTRRAVFCLLLTALTVAGLAAPAGAEETPPEGVRVVVVGGSGVISAHVTGHFLGCLGREVDRIAGRDRYATAAAMSRDRFATTTAVVLARGDHFPDALAGGPLAARLGAPLLLTRSTSIPGITLDEIRRLGATTVYVLGGPGAISDSVATQLEAEGLTVIRLAGSDRYGTAAAIAAESHPNGADTVYLALGTSFVDALPAAPAAYHSDAPMLLTASDALPGTTIAALLALDPTRVVVIGGTGSVSAAVAAELAAYTDVVDRIAGSNRFHTAELLAQVAFPTASTVYLTVSDNFPDGLAAAGLATDGPILYVEKNAVSGHTAQETSRHAGGDCGDYRPRRMSSFTTYHACCENRVTNIHIIADTLNGYILDPGATLSVNEYVGQRTEAKGYLRDGAIIGGKVYCCDHWLNVGGGVSQYATTLFNAIFFGSYEIVKHRPHSIWFSRYPMGREATIGWTAPDLVFTNDTLEPVEIRSHYTSRSITVELWGDNGGRSSAAYRSGSATTADGGTVTSYRTITYADGSQITQSWTHKYRGKGSDDDGGGGGGGEEPPPPPPGPVPQ